MNNSLLGPRQIVERLGGSDRPRYSLCCMVTRLDEYAGCIASLQAGGFTDEGCERLIVDNSGGNKADAFEGLNELLQAAQGDLIILHHQDIVLHKDGRAALDKRLDALSKLDPKWAICANAGRTADGWPAICISHPYDKSDVRGGPFPVPVVSVDENFIVVRRIANLALSADLKGFHHYGVDLCTMADVLGWNSYVIDYFLRHNSGGSFDGSYDASLQAIQKKYRRAFRSRMAFLITSREFVLSGAGAYHLARPWLRRFGKLIGVVPRNQQLEDPSYLAGHGRMG